MSTIPDIPPPNSRPWKSFGSLRENQTLKLPDGRSLGFAEFGPENGTPLIFFHGSPGNRYDGIGYLEEAILLDVRLIVPDRPGFGLSSPKRDMKLLDYPKDISALVAHLGLSQYHIAGQSGGGPYTAVCVYALPESQVKTASIIAGMVPPEFCTVKNAGWYTPFALGVYQYFPGVTERITDWFYPAKFWADEKAVQKSLDWAYMLLNKEDKAEMAKEWAQPVIRTIVREAFRQGAVGSAVDSRVLGEPWGFQLGDVRRHVKLMWMRDDTRTPVAFGKVYEDGLPDAELRIFEGKSHFRLEEVSLDVIAAAVGKEGDITEDMRERLKVRMEEIEKEGM